MIAELERTKGESDCQYFSRLMKLENKTVKEISVPKKKAGEPENEHSYFIRCAQTEANEKDESDRILGKINDIATELMLKNLDTFLKRDQSEKIIPEDDNSTSIKKTNRYYFRIISMEKLIKRNEMNDLYETVKDINSIIYYDGKLSGFLIGFLDQNYKNFFKNFSLREDLIHSAYEEFFANICRYNGEFDITTFGKLHLTRGITKFIRGNDNMTAHYNEQYVKIKKEIDRLQLLGYTEDEASSVSKLMDCESLKGLSAATIAATLKQKKATVVETYDPEYQTGLNEKFSSPEEEALKQERIEAFNKIYEGLRPYQRFLLYACNGELDLDASKPEFGYNEDLIAALKKDGMYNVIKKDSEGREYVKKDMINNLYQITLTEARALSHYKGADKEKEKMDRDLSKYGSSVINTNYDLLSEEDEDIIFNI